MLQFSRPSLAVCGFGLRKNLNNCDNLTVHCIIGTFRNGEKIEAAAVIVNTENFGPV